MLLLYRTRKDPQWTLPIYTCCGGYPVDSARFEPGRLSLAALIVEAPLSENLVLRLGPLNSFS
jgi:hypothetical protein